MYENIEMKNDKDFWKMLFLSAAVQMTQKGIGSLVYSLGSSNDGSLALIFANNLSFKSEISW